MDPAQAARRLVRTWERAGPAYEVDALRTAVGTRGHWHTAPGHQEPAGPLSPG